MDEAYLQRMASADELLTRNYKGTLSALSELDLSPQVTENSLRSADDLKEAANERIGPVQSKHDRDAPHRHRHASCDGSMRSNPGDRPAHEAR